MCFAVKAKAWNSAFGASRYARISHVTGRRDHPKSECDRGGDDYRWIPREELYRLYAGAKAFVYPSMFEGFGMPVVEAMAARVPVACSNISPIREITNGTTLSFDPTSEREMMEAIEFALQGGEGLIESAFQRARCFSWHEAARKTLAVIESVSGVGAKTQRARVRH